MAADLPYLQSYKRVDKLFQKIHAARQPEAFTHRFLTETLGLKSVADRGFIPLLRALGFLDSSNRPSSDYAALKNDSQAPRAIALGIRRAYAPLFAANESAHALPQDQLKGLVAQVAGSDAGMTTKIVGTLSALMKLADFSPQAERPPEGERKEHKKEPEEAEGDRKSAEGAELHPEFHYNLQIHLPPSGTEETYLNIFNAIRRVFR